MGLRGVGLGLVLVVSCWGAENAQTIVDRSVANVKADWSAAPRYDFTEHDIETKHGNRTTATYEVLMIDGSPYNRMIAENGRPLSAAAAAREESKLAEETRRRQEESRSERRRRVAEFERERDQDHALLNQMVKAFQFHLAGTETVNGRSCYVLDATPKPGYVAPNRETEVLKGMRGKMWVDTQQLKWVKVEAEVYRPVSFGLFFARVFPGTRFELEQAPVSGKLWLPSHFVVQVRARILILSRRSTDDETYSRYHLAG